jgi:hypothetical protein
MREKRVWEKRELASPNPCIVPSEISSSLDSTRRIISYFGTLCQHKSYMVTQVAGMLSLFTPSHVRFMLTGSQAY